jgi:hypothetical protein
MPANASDATMAAPLMCFALIPNLTNTFKVCVKLHTDV